MGWTPTPQRVPNAGAASHRIKNDDHEPKENADTSIAKDTVLQFLRGDGQHQQADQAAQELPDQVDTDQHAGLLSKLGVNPVELIAKFTGGLGGMLGELL